MCTLVIVENEEQVKDVLKRKISNDLLWIATGPYAMHELEKQNISYDIPENYYKTEELSKICEESRFRIKLMCDILDNLLSQKIKEVRNNNIKPTLFYYHALIQTIDGVVARTFQIKRFLEQIKPESIIVHNSAVFPFATYKIAFNNREFIYGRILSLPGWNVKIYILPEVIVNSMKNQPLLQIFKGKIAVSYILKLLKSIMLYKGVYPSICLYKPNYEWLSLSAHLKNIGIRVITFPDQNINFEIINYQTQKQLIQEIEKNINFRNIFIWDKIDIYPLIKDRVAYLLKDNVNKVVGSFEKAVNFFEKNKVKAVLTTAKPEAIDHAICFAAQQLEIPVINWQHGSAGFYVHHTIEYFDFLTTNFYFTYGNETRKNMLKKAEMFGTTLKSVGSCSLDLLKSNYKKTHQNKKLLQWVLREKKTKQKICLYCTTNYFENNWYSGYDPPPSDTLFYRTQMSIVNGLLKCPNLVMLLKLHPNTTYRQPPWVQCLHGNGSVFIISNEATFMQLLQYADLIVLDWPSTTLLQSLTTNKPVFVVIKHLYFLTEARETLSRRAVCADEPEGLLKIICKFLETNVYSANISDNTFLKSYGTCLDDGNSCKRAFKEVLDILKLN